MRRRFRLDHPLDVGATVGALAQGRSDPCLRRAAGGLWRATRTPLGPATVCLDDRFAEPLRPGGLVTVDAWGPGAEWALAHAADLLGLADDPTGFRPADPLVREAYRRHPGLRLCRSLAVTEALLPTIVGQKVQTVAAHRSWRAIVARFGEPAPGPGDLLLPPDPRRLASLGYEALHRCNIERKRADAIRQVCARAGQIDGLAALPGPDLQRRLQTLPGIGVWTTSTVAQLALGDSDAVVVGDYHLPHVVSWALVGEPRATDDRMLELLEPYRGHRGRVQRLLSSARHHPPRRGPKLRVIAFADREQFAR
jgi:3-methyladenine DNA glycosylase/8-oxoguanine DNA glycosylase